MPIEPAVPPQDPQYDDLSPVLPRLLAALVAAEKVRAESVALLLTTQLTITELEAINEEAMRLVSSRKGR